MLGGIRINGFKRDYFKNNLGLSYVAATLLIVLITVAGGFTISYFIKGQIPLIKSSYKKSSQLASPPLLIYAGWRGVGILHVRHLVSNNFSVYVSPVGKNAWIKAEVVSYNINPSGTSIIVFSTSGLSPGNYLVKIHTPQGASDAERFKIKNMVLFSSGECSLSHYYFFDGHSLHPQPGFFYKIFDIRGLASVPSPSSILSLPESRLIASGVTNKIDYTDASRGFPQWPQSQKDRFAAIFNTTLVLPVPSIVRFDVLTDDGAAIMIDGNLAYTESWKLQAAKEYVYTTSLPQGRHSVKIIYFENYGQARLRVKISVNPASRSPYDILWIKGYYYDTSSNNPSRPDPSKIESGAYPLLLSRVENRIDFTDHPSNTWPVANPDRFAAKYNVLVQVNQPGLYELYAESDDGIIVKVNGTTEISDWSLHATRHYSKKINLDRGIYSIEVLYYENTGVARLLFSLNFLKSTAYAELTPRYHAYVYDISSWNKWYSGALDNLEQNILKGNFPLIGEWDLDYINYTDNPSYGGEYWFFGHGGNIDNFGIVFNTTINIEAEGSLYIRTYSDDGVRVYVDDKKIHDDWSLHAPRTLESENPISKGEHRVTIVYFEHTGTARLDIKMRWEKNIAYNYPINSNKIYIEAASPTLKGHTIIVLDDKGNIIAESKITAKGTITVDLRKIITIPLCLVVLE